MPQLGTLADLSDWGRRPDGTSKGTGFLGALILPNGDVATEFSIADSEKLKDAKGNYLDYPSLVPTLTKSEVQAVLKAASDPTHRATLPDAVYEKAEAYALRRRQQGLPLFAQPGESQDWLHPDLPRAAVRSMGGDIQLPNQSGQPDPRLLSSLASLGLLK